MKRTGIYGGSFNPVHLGHLHLAEWLCRQGFVDEVWLMVSPLNPFKKQADDLLDDQARLELTRMAVASYPCLSVCDLEFRLERPSYMYRTLETLRRMHPDREFVLIIGADNWNAFDRWARHEEILTHHRIVVYPREGYPIDMEKLPEGVQLAQAPLFPVSSTSIRHSLAQGKDVSHTLPPEVEQEICRKGYYQQHTPKESSL